MANYMEDFSFEMDNLLINVCDMESFAYLPLRNFMLNNEFGLNFSSLVWSSPWNYRPC